MNQDEYQKKFDEHRQSIGAEEDSLELRSSRRAKSTKPQKKKRKNVLAPTLFFIFILIPVCILIYVQFFYSPAVEEAEQVDQEIIQVETKPISNSNDEEKEVPKVAEEEPAKIEVEETTEKEPVVVKPEEKIVEVPKVEPKVEPKVKPKVEPKTQSRTSTTNQKLFKRNRIK